LQADHLFIDPFVAALSWAITDDDAPLECAQRRHADSRGRVSSELISGTPVWYPSEERSLVGTSAGSSKNAVDRG